MPVIIDKIQSPLDAGEKDIISKALRSVGITADSVTKARIHKTSLDARKRSNIHFVHSVYVELGSEDEERRLSESRPSCRFAARNVLSPVISNVKDNGRVCIAGFGPAGIFCGLLLAEYGYKPLILEKGGSIDERTQAVSSYWRGGKLDTRTNVQFGEGGAGTFSDGKLTTRIKDPLCRYVLERFVEFGAPEEILTKAKPHIGTDRLRGIVKKARERIIELGGEVRFNSALTDFALNGGRVKNISFIGGSAECSCLVLAAGHSARDTFTLLERKGIFLEPKAFSVGVRIEHTQDSVDRSLYGEYAGNPLLPKGEYQLSAHTPEGRAVYTFCMCPGGFVVPSASEDETVVTNGMSEFARDGRNANAAVAVAVSPKDFGTGALDGMRFARELERRAYAASDGRGAPAVTVGAFLNGGHSISSHIEPTYARGVCEADLSQIFPKFVIDSLKFGIRDFSHKMQCFSDGGALMTAPETRTSSPVRITRGEKLNSLSAENLFPCGEGAGYAGGIMSAAVDGLRVALEIMKRTAPEK